MSHRLHMELDPPSNPVGRRAAIWPDVAFIALLLAAWAYFVWPIVVREQRHGGDIFRDVASAVNIQYGQVFVDPAYRGEALWYPPLSPAAMAAVASVLSISPTDAYRWSALLFNWLIPVGLFAVVRLQWGRRAAIGATIALLLAMPWWQSEVVQGQPSVQAAVWAWAVMLLYGKQARARSAGWAVACGVLLGVSFWHHPFIPAVLTLAIACNAVVECAKHRRADRDALAGVVQRNVALLGLTLVIAAPILYLMLHGPVLNRTPREFMDEHLWTTRFALMHRNAWIWFVGFVGLVAAWRQRETASRLLVIVVLLCAFGQLPAYLRHDGPAWAANFTVIVPHEFQWTFQLGWAICVGVGIDRTVAFLAARVRFMQRSRAAVCIVTAAAFVLTGYFGAREAKDNLRLFVHPYAQNFPDASAWIRENTSINDVFACEVEWAFAWLNPDTGRKVWITARGHSNPRVDWDERKRVLGAMAAADSPEAFWRLARENGIDYCVPSRGWAPRVLIDPVLGPQTVPRYLEEAYVGDAVRIFKVVESPGE